MTFIQTVSGNKFDVMNCTPDDIDIKDIGHSLALSNRFYGHTKKPYSIAQHSVLCADVAAQRLVDVKIVRSMLLHDAAEAYVGDVAKHIKHYLGKSYRELEDRVESAIQIRFDLIPMNDDMKQIDHDLLETEFQELMGGGFEGRPVYGNNIPDLITSVWNWDTAERIFMHQAFLLGCR